MTGLGDGIARIAAALAGEDDAPDPGPQYRRHIRFEGGEMHVLARAADVVSELQEDMERDYARRLAKWERDAPRRALAEQAMRAADARRRAELGLGEPEPYRVAAALDWTRPQPPSWLI